MKRNESFFKACTERKVPYSLLAKLCVGLDEKTPEEQDSIREEWAKKIEATYPYKEGREPKS